MLMAGPPTALVEIQQLTRVYRIGSADVRALDGIDLDITAGEFVAIVGVSGSGKSTLLHLIGGLDSPSAGSIRVQGKELASLSPYERALYRRTMVGFVFQSFQLIPTMTATANVGLALTLQGTLGKERAAQTAEALRWVGLEQRANHRPAELSGGEQQRVAVARALVRRPPLLLADEPTGNLDRRTAAEVIELLLRCRQEHGATVIMVTHDEATASRTADRVICLRDGRMEAP